QMFSRIGLHFQENPSKTDSFLRLVPPASANPQAYALERDALEFRGPSLARFHRQRTGQCAGGKEFAGSKRRIVGVTLKQTGHVTDPRRLASEHVRAAAAIHQCPVAIQLDLEFR